MDSDQLVNKPLVRSWGWWGLIWLTIFPFIGVFVSIKFHNPEFLGETAWFTFGRMRPVHVNGVIFGAFSTLFIALMYYAVPRLCGRRIYREEWGHWLLWLWNAFLILGTGSFLLGHNMGFEAGEFTWPFNLLRFFVLGMVTVQVLGTVFQRREPRFYVSLWYITAAFVWTVFNLVLGNVVLPYGPFTGVDSAAMHGLYIHYIVGLWLTPAGLAIIYYFLPLAAKQSLFSHKLSLLGFWSLALFYPFVGTHHYLFSPIPYWTQTISIVTSMLLIIPVWTVIVNFFGTVRGRWGQVLGGTDADAYAGKFLILGAVYYLFGCFQGSVEALRRMQELTHFNDFVIAHSHLTVFGSMVVWVVGGMYYVWPRLTGKQLWSAKLASWHLWLTIGGFSVMAVGLTAQGFVQGSMLEHGANFVDTVNEMKPWWVARTLGGLAMDIAILFMLINFYKSAQTGVAVESMAAIEQTGEKVPMAPLQKGGNWLETPSGVVVGAGIFLFGLAVGTQGIAPYVTSKQQRAQVTDVVADTKINVPSYTPLEERGREVYIREGCWYCHSQYVRPVTGENFRWGPVSQNGEYVHDLPHLFSTRRIGPDLARVGRRYSDGWHAAHHWDPQAVKKDSIMPRFPWLFEKAEDEGEAPKLNEDGKALVAYIQRLGTAIGDWRENFVSTNLSVGASVNPGSHIQKDLLPLGKKIYDHRCSGCHGDEGDGNGPSAKFLDPKPRDFTQGIFKFHSTPGQDALPTDGDLFKTITHGLWGTSMPPWHNLTQNERLAVIQYIKTFSDRWEKEEVKDPIAVPRETPVTLASIDNGGQLYVKNCQSCHGAEGLGNGPLAGVLNDAWGFPIQPANFTLPAGEEGGVKLGHDSRHLFRTIMNGVGGDPMPAFQGALNAKQVWDIVHFVQSLRVQSYEDRLLAVGVDPEALEDARRNIWAMLSNAANQGRLQEKVVELTDTNDTKLGG
ncbi:putative Cytochrome c oxidase, fused subunits I, II, and III (modular protein) [Nitrospina gracilis 3/211]|uniref:Putative Cytochrome c oxidase, fused subunits I, II, and III (Modular protein) n=1 Tax=Nitrospina gracilis (strain 3/211) TaxID=1266370 RepID=M1YYC0_NITG3|nr:MULTISPECIES: cbb3-type cytochrome c oxidase subunit I [Nitrospina]MCF8723209.1 cbb3-type cytochrome c oxidase subunit I [Nitrospina sp. Nb-3]CCQ90255.1 putative Cytochrome c oxidase, fused subunits I, II, and III (modular protein) [Nitrospina gracilis 3/211]